MKRLLKTDPTTPVDAPPGTRWLLESSHYFSDNLILGLWRFDQEKIGWPKRPLASVEINPNRLHRIRWKSKVVVRDYLYEQQRSRSRREATERVNSIANRVNREDR